MAHGCICVLADAWGSDEYLKDGVNGLRIPGRQGRHWEFRPEHGVIAERHADLEGVDHAFVARAVDAIDPLLRDPGLRTKLSEAARAYVSEHHDIKQIRATFRDAIQAIQARATAGAGRMNSQSEGGQNRPRALAAFLESWAGRLRFRHRARRGN
jgi:glycosyltransferase involved in cell wall biosynthesis